MSWTIGASTGCFYPFQTTERSLYSIGEAGFEVAELFLQSPSEYTPLFGRRALRAMLAGGVRVHSIHLNMKDLDPFSPYAPRRADSDLLFRQALELAQSIQAGVVNWHGARRSEVEQGVASEESIRETLERWLAWAEEAGVTLTVENVSWCMTRSPADVAALAATHPTLAFTFDSFQAMESGIPPVALARAMGQRLATVHLSDIGAAGERHLVPGRGLVPWADLLRALADLPYRGPLIVEIGHLDEARWRGALDEGRHFLAALIDQLELRLRPLH